MPDTKENLNKQAAADKPFVHLHVHTEYSLLDGATRIEDMLEKCKALNMPAIAVTDHGNMYCAWKFVDAAKKVGIKPIVGCEFYVCENHLGVGSENKEYYHLILLAKNNVGYVNLCRLNSVAFTEGFYYKPRIDFALLKAHSEGLICLSACIAGQLPRLFLADRPDDARALALEYKALFKDDYYIELQRHGIKEEDDVMPQLVSLARELDIKLIVTNDVHYLNKEDAELQDIMMCVQMGRVYDDPDRMKFQGEEFYLKNYEEMSALFPNVPDAMDTSLEIAAKCDVSLGKEKLLPNYVPKNGMTPEEFLRFLTEEGIKEKYPDCTKEIRERIEYEYSVITGMGFVEYYLIVWDFINYAKTNGIPVGPGRGSGAGSVISYLMGITEVEPFRYNLMFERFLNPERKTMPDFDVDFCMDRRGEVIDYVHEKYGEGKVSQIVTFGTMAAKNAIRDVARVLRLPISESNRLAKMVPNAFRYNLKNLLGFAPYKKPEDTFISQELKDAYDDPATHRVIDLAMKIEGAPRQTGMHAAGVVICRDRISEHIPLQTNGGAVAKGGIVTTQYTMGEVEEAGLLKMDFLGLRTLTDIKKAIDYIYEDFGIKVDFSKQDYSDPEVFKLISSGDTMCIFQLESGGMCDLMKRMQPDGLEDVIAGISLYRPGPMQFIPSYIECKRNKKKIKYTHPMMEPILSVTNGCIVYQEQVMQIVRSLAGFSMALADNVRYAMSKKKYAMMKELGEFFVHGGDKNGEHIKGCIASGIPEETARKIYDELNDFSQYAFNKSHATCYAYVTYQTAYLKKYYPVEFLCAMLNNRINDITSIKKYIVYAKNENIGVLPPDINKSRDEFSVENGALRFGLGAIKNIGVTIVKQIAAERERNGEFADMQDFFERTLEFLNKRMVENLIKGGAFDCFGRTRADMLQRYQEELDDVTERAKKHATGQISIFDMMPELKTVSSSTRDMAKEFSKQVLYNFEKEVLGMYMSGSPLDDYDALKDKFRFDFDTSETMAVLPEGADEDAEPIRPIVEKRFVTAGGILRDTRTVKGKDNRMMAFGVLEDKFDSIEVALFSPAYDSYKTLFAEDAFVIVRGNLGESRDGYKITIKEILSPQNDETRDASFIKTDEPKVTLWLKMEERDGEVYSKVIEALSGYEGDIPVKIKIAGKPFNLETKVRDCSGIRYELELILGKDNAIFFTSNK